MNVNYIVNTGEFDHILQRTLSDVSISFFDRLWQLWSLVQLMTGWKGTIGNLSQKIFCLSWRAYLILCKWFLT